MLAELPACMQGYMHAYMHALFAGDVYVCVHVQVYKYFGLETNTIDFVGHAVALYPSDEWVLHASTLLLYFTVSSLCLSCLKAYIYIYLKKKAYIYMGISSLCSCVHGCVSVFIKVVACSAEIGAEAWHLNSVYFLFLFVQVLEAADAGDNGENKVIHVFGLSLR